MTHAHQAQPSQTNLGPSEAASRAATPPDVTCRRAVAGDAERISEIGREVFTITFAHTCSDADLQDYLNDNFTPEIIAAELADPAKWFSVGCVGDAIAAFSVLRTGTSEPCIDHIPEAERIEVQRVYADAHFHGKGVARSLMEYTLDLARKEGFNKAWLGVWEHNYRARRFYEKFGFGSVGSHDFWVGDDRQLDDIFLLEL